MNRKVMFKLKEYNSKKNRWEYVEEEKEGFLLQFGIDTSEQGYPNSVALIEDYDGYVHSVELDGFRFVIDKLEGKRQ